MSFDDNDYYDDIDYYDRVNHLGIYKDPEPEPDPEDDIYLHGLDPDELGNMSEERRREAIRDAGLDPDDYDDDMFSGHSVGGRSAGTHRSSSTNQSSKQNIVVKFLEAIIIISIIAAIVMAIEAFAGELVAVVILIIIFIVLMNYV
ncbi:MAG: hypothetical protein K6C35_04150 [Eubacterium sp.]|nr:hypothetical protein [Eubacterium sp.]